MEQITETENYCLSCLCTPSERKLLNYKIKYAHFRAIFDVDSIKLCYLCRRMACQAELFVQNVQSNQILLENCLGDISTTVRETLCELQLPITLSVTPISTEDLSSDNTFNSLAGTFTNIIENCPKKYKNCNKSSNKIINVSVNNGLLIIGTELDNGDVQSNIKVENIEMKQELDHLEGEFIDENDELHSPYVKEEDDYPLNELLKQERIEVTTPRAFRKKMVKKKKIIEQPIVKDYALEKEQKRIEYNDSLGIEVIYITEEQCIEERKQQALDEKYLNLTYKCEDCLKGFNFKASYELHLQKHNPVKGQLECNICKLRMNTEDQLTTHKKYHTTRYKCTVCGITRISRGTIKEHFAAYHHTEKLHTCPYCDKTFKRQVSQRKHIRYTHTRRERVTCEYCKKSYANKDVLKSHMMNKHPTEVSAREEIRRFACKECGATFKSPSHLRIHGLKHSSKREFYCVECDKAFKSETVLKTHLKTAQPHVNYMELPLPCEHCEKRFSKRRDLDRHMNRIHLDIRPYQCDKCDKAYVSKWSLQEHNRYVHERYKRPLRYPCHLCDKIFDRNSILKCHIRTHTGERPYQCSKCPAQFGQAGVLATHTRLVHLNLTRDGRPKAAAVT